jgi:hypothetical protein
MKTITLSPLHDLQIRKPAEWTALVDLTVSWPTDPEDPRFRSRLVRCSAAAIGLVLDDDRLPVPAYRTASMDPVAYGVSVVEVLIPQRVQLAEILRAGREIADWLAGTLPSEQEVAQTADFTDGGESRT